ncbi:MAG TPA: STAS domain-containing protein [Planctomycetota bacterium]|nr:STAS domain-containing protein [Planctomycetota bacterium]
MHTHIEHAENFATLHLRGEFDTFYCKHLQDEIDGLVQSGVTRVVLVLRLVKFVNSTALGAIIKAAKTLAAKGGKLVIAQPSPFCREIIGKVGIDRVVPVFDTQEQAQKALFGAAAPAPRAAPPVAEDDSSVLFAPTDAAAVEQFLGHVRPVKGVISPVHGHDFGANAVARGRMSSLDERCLVFQWSAPGTGLDPTAMSALLPEGLELRVKFRLPLFQVGFSQATAKVDAVEPYGDGVRVVARFSRIEEETLNAVRQFSADMKLLKDELKHTAR